MVSATQQVGTAGPQPGYNLLWIYSRGYPFLTCGPLTSPTLASACLEPHLPLPGTQLDPRYSPVTRETLRQPQASS